MAKEMKVTAVANWYGSNRMLAHRVGQELAGCSLVVVPFAGGMSELPHIDAGKILVNDLHRHVINLARVMGDRAMGPQLYRRLRRMTFDERTLENAQARCRLRDAAHASDFAGMFGNDRNAAIADDSAIEWAADYFICSWMGRGGKSGSKGEFAQSLPLRYSPNGGGSAQRFFSAVEGVPVWRRVLRKCEFSSEDAFDFLAKQHDSPRVGLYLDPPWPGPGKKYVHTFADAMQRRVVESLGRFTQARIVVRYGDHPLIRDLFPAGRWTWLELGGRDQANDEAADVLLINGPSLAKTAA